MFYNHKTSRKRKVGKAPPLYVQLKCKSRDIESKHRRWDIGHAALSLALFLFLIKMYSVVKFKSDNSVQLVPSSWISVEEGRKRCRWPPGPSTNVTKLIKDRKCDKSWPTLEASVFRSTGRYFLLYCKLLYIFPL